MGDYQLLSPDGQHVAELIYETEPPHGDSLHRLLIDGQRFPGQVWGRRFAFSADGDWLGFSWAGDEWESRTVICDIPGRRFAVLPRYVSCFILDAGEVVGVEACEGFRQALTSDDFRSAW